MEIRENHSLKKYNTFGIDVACRYFVESDSEEELLDFVRSYELDPAELLVLGGGSDFLFTEDFPGTVFYPTMKDIKIMAETDQEVLVRVGAGVVWDDFVAWAVAHQYGGVENLSLIPGHVGASPVQNVGAYGMEAGDTIRQVEALDMVKLERTVLEARQCRFSYRNSIFKEEWKNRFIITYVVFRLAKSPVLNLEYGNVKEEIAAMGKVPSLQTVRQAIINIREAKLPDVKVTPNAGSFFKNPAVDKELADRLLAAYPGMPVYPVDGGRVKLAAGWMIEQCGWKGKTLGRAGVHDRQALVLVNRGGADGCEVAHLANEIKKSVFVKFGVWIEPEVYII